MTCARTLFSWLALAAALAGCGDPVYANQTISELVDGERSSAGGVCTPIGDGRSGGGGIVSGGDAEGDLHYQHTIESDSLIVDISSQGRLLEHREYSEARLRAGKRDQFIVETVAGRSYEVTYWGSDDCELPPLEQ
jgi:hypothetical protein